MGIFNSLLGKKTPEQEEIEGQARQPQGVGFWQGGDTFRGRDALAGALAVLGDAFMARAGAQPSAVAGLTGGRSDAQELARKALAAEDQRKREREDYTWKLGESARVEAEKPRFEEDNVGNRWKIYPNGQRELIFVDKNPRYNFINGMMVETTNAYADKPAGYTEGDTSGGLPIPTLQDVDPLQQLKAERERRRALRGANDFLGR